MSGKTAKALRRLAQTMTVGQQDRVYGYKLKGKSPTGEIMLGKCTRSAYKHLKKLHKNPRLIGSVKRKEPSGDI
jgi:hypothetical protein